MQRHGWLPVVALVGVMVSVGVAVRPVTCAIGGTCGSSQVTDISVEATGETYTAATGNPRGFFQTGQDADILLSGIDFNNTGGSQLFNHPAGLATDGTRLIMADSFNNRVLIWRTLPTSNVAPDLVLGQANFTTNASGNGRQQMNFPVQVSTDGQRLAVADAYNDRILIWTTFPTTNGAAADIMLQGPQMGTKGKFSWPWGVWTNGQKLVVAGTGTGNVVIWNTFPAVENAKPDVVLSGSGTFGTPRMIISNGTTLIVGDHNAKVAGKAESGSYFWRTVPTADETPFDFYMEDPQKAHDGWFKGTFTSDGKLLALGGTLYAWNSVPVDDKDGPDLTIASSSYDFRTGDGGGIAVAGGRVYVSSANLNKIVVYNSFPTSTTQLPDFAIGSPAVCTNTLYTNFFIGNPVAVSNGTSLFVASDHQAKFFVWRKLPEQSGARPDFVYSLPAGPWGAAISGQTVAIVGGQSVYVWDSPPLNGELPSRTFAGGIGSVRFADLRGVAIDDRYFYVADASNNKVYVWSGIPSSGAEPAFTLTVNKPYRISSDGTYLTVTTPFDHQVLVYPVSGLSAATTPIAVGGAGTFNLPQGAHAAYGRLFVADTSFHRVHVWSDIRNALAGQPADIVVGESSFGNVNPDLARNKVFWPGSVFFDGRYLWVGEYKFSGRLLRFSPSTPAGAGTLALDRSIVRFGGVTGLTTATPAQEVTVTQTGGNRAAWTATADQPWVQVTSGTGTGTGKFTISVVNTAALPSSGVVSATVWVTASGIANAPVALPVSLVLRANSTAGSATLPFGIFDSPADGTSGVTGSIGVTGWALDDIGVAGVKIYRNCLTGIDIAGSCQVVDGASLVFIGDAAFLAGARPDVETAFPTSPLAYRAGWGYLMLTNLLPHSPNRVPGSGGQGTLTLSAYATDVEGNRVRLGQKTIVLDNDHANRPFGAIDTPGQGQTVAGAGFANFGWVLTPGTATIPVDGSTLRVVVDGAVIGTVSYNQCRAGSTNRPPAGTCRDDIATLFPTYTNITGASGAIGSFTIDTTALSNGLHTIAWGALDSQNRNDGIGSRFFTVLNGSALTADERDAITDAPARAIGRSSDLADRAVSADRVSGRIGFNFEAPLEEIAPDQAGVRHVALSELGRLELRLGDAVTGGYLNANGQLRSLPPGSRLDATGVFTWAPGPGYLGTYDLTFVQDLARIPIRVTIQPKRAETAGLVSGAIEVPAPGATLSRTLTIAGWALDLGAWQGSGVGAVHVWAQRTDSPADAPIFVGAADLGSARPEAAAAFGAQFDRSGWGLTTVGLAPGVYDITAYFWSRRTGRFEDARTVTVSVR